MYVELSKVLQRDTEESLNEAESILSKANRQQLSVFDPGTQLSNKPRALDFLNGGTVAFPTGIPELHTSWSPPLPPSLTPRMEQEHTAAPQPGGFAMSEMSPLIPQ